MRNAMSLHQEGNSERVTLRPSSFPRARASQKTPEEGDGGINVT